MQLQQFSDQVERLAALGYPALLGLDAPAWRAALTPLARHVPHDSSTAPAPENGAVPFVLVINSPLATVRQTLPLVQRRGKPAVERLYPVEPEQFRPIDAVRLPAGHAYLMLDIDRGSETRNVAPDAALGQLTARGKSPLTIEEGVALLTHFPEFLQPNNCFSMLASRCGDKRVPALWLSDGRPKLGWCWAGNPHTWLGSASCSQRSAGVQFTSR